MLLQLIMTKNMLKSSAALRRFNKIGFEVGFNTGMAEWVCSGFHIPSYKLFLSNFSFVSNVFAIHDFILLDGHLLHFFWKILPHSFYLKCSTTRALLLCRLSEFFPPLFGRPRPRKVLSSQPIFSSSRSIRSFNSLRELFQSTACLH